MAHKCTRCGNIVENGSKELLKGCSDCNNRSWELINRGNTQETKTTTQETNQDDDGFINSDEIESPSGIDILGGYSEDTNLDTERDNDRNKSSYQTITEKQTIQDNLNSQYEGIKIVDGEWKINLAELYRGHQYVVRIGDDGSYEISEVSP